MDSSFVTDVLRSMLYQTPSMLVAIAGIIVVVVNWRRASSASVFAVIAFAILLGSSLIMPAVQVSVWRSASATIATRANIQMVIGIVWALLHAATYAGLLVAVYLGRPASGPPPMSRR